MIAPLFSNCYSSEIGGAYFSIPASLKYCDTMNLQMPTFIFPKILPIDDLNMIHIHIRYLNIGIVYTT